MMIAKFVSFHGSGEFPSGCAKLCVSVEDRLCCVGFDLLSHIHPPFRDV